MKGLLLGALMALSGCACWPNCGDAPSSPEANAALIGMGLSMLQPPQVVYAPAYVPPYQTTYTRTVCRTTQWGADCVSQ